MQATNISLVEVYMSLKNSPTRILICFESDCGGETNIVKSLIKTLEIKSVFQIISKSQPTIYDWGFVSLFSWIIKSIIQWSIVIINSHRVDCVYTTTFTAGLSAIILKPFLKFKIIFHYHGSRVPPKKIVGSNLKKMVHKFKYSVLYLLHSYLINNSNLIFVPSLIAKNSLTRIFPLSKPAPIYVVPNGIDIKKFLKPIKFAVAIERSKFNINKSSKVILIIGRLDPKKNIQKIIESIKILESTQKALNIIIAHPKIVNKTELDYKRQLMKSIENLKVKSNFVWLSNFRNIRLLYWISDVAVSASSTETFSLTMLESFASGTLFVSTPVGEVRKLLEKTDRNLIISKLNSNQISNKIQYALNLPKKSKKKIISNEKLTVKMYTIEKMADNVQSLIQKASEANLISPSGNRTFHSV